MDTQAQINYERIAKAIAFIKANFREQPSLNTIAEEVHLSPYHFQRLFTEWAGVSPKKFMQHMSLARAKSLLDREETISAATYGAGLSGTGRLHDLFVGIEGMTPGEYKNGGQGLVINYGFSQSPFGELIVASTAKGVCHMAFTKGKQQGLAQLKERYPKAEYSLEIDGMQQQALAIFDKDWRKIDRIKLHLHGTPFQLKVWEALLKIPLGGLATYGKIAQQIGRPNASRAVGTAIANNPIAYLIPCHRVIRASGNYGEYAWGTTRKTAMIGWEAARAQP